MPLKNAPKRNIASAIDLLEQDYDSVVGGVRFTELPIKQIQPYHDHRFHLYEGQRLEDMVESMLLTTGFSVPMKEVIYPTNE